MINRIDIKNFKSIVDISLEIGRFNVLIGANGSGKTNILEAIAFGAAAEAHKLDFEFLGSRGIRATNPEFMYSAFKKNSSMNPIHIELYVDEKQNFFDIQQEESNPKKWNEKNFSDLLKQAYEMNQKLDESKREIEAMRKIMGSFEKTINKSGDESNKTKLTEVFSQIDSVDDELKQKMEQLSSIIKTTERRQGNPEISNYIIYTPEQTSLRKFEESTQMYPLGIKGEGLFQHLKNIKFSKKNVRIFNAIKNNLFLFDWFEDIIIPKNLLESEYSLKIKDKYLFDDLKYFDQRSANEGFLFLLFYSTLFISNETPRFFSIDNIDSSLNPRLCAKLTNRLVSLSKKYNKQVIVTTQNPFILDGLNLQDDSQRLFVVRRNEEGHTKIKRIEYNPKRKKSLSEIWSYGYIGGLPDNF